MLEDSDGEGDQEQVQHELCQLCLVEVVVQCGWFMLVCSLGTGIMWCPEYVSTCLDLTPFLTIQSRVTTFPKKFYWGVQLAALLRITSTGNYLASHTPRLGFPLEVELQGLQDKHCFPKDLTAAAATQPSPDKSGQCTTPNWNTDPTWNYSIIVWFGR